METVSEPAVKKSLTTADLLAMPDDGVERWLINGELREKGEDGVTTRSVNHSAVEAKLAYLFIRWLETQPPPRGRALSGEVRVRLRKTPDSFVGMDVVCTGPNPIIGRIGNNTFLDGPPLVAVEILSPTDEHAEIKEKVLDYLAAGVSLVWIVDPDFQTVTVHRHGAVPLFFNQEQQLEVGTILQGFRVSIAEIFSE